MSQFKQYLRESIIQMMNEEQPNIPRPDMAFTRQDANRQQPKFTTANREGKPLPISKAYMENLYGPMWQWIVGLLSQIFGPDWFNQFQNIIHDGSWNWPGWTPNGEGGYYLEFGGGQWAVWFIDGSWQFSFAQP